MSKFIPAMAIASLVWGIGLVMYRLFLHPLAKYPGPPLAAITNWYSAYHAWKGNLHTHNRKLHEKYGDIIRYGPNSIDFNTHSGMNTIYSTRANVRKTETYVAMSASRRTPNTISSTDKTVHGFKRRIMSQVFSDHGLRSVEERFLPRINDFVTLLWDGNVKGSTKEDESVWGSPRNMATMCGWLAFDIISDLSFGEHFNMLKSPELRWFPSVISKLAQRVAIGMIQPKFFNLKIDRLFMASQVKDILNAGTWIRKRSELRACLGNDIKQKDLLYNMMNATDPKTGISFNRKDLWLESIMLLTAGSDTTSAAMASTLFLLAHDPESLARLTEEIRVTYSNEDEIRIGQKLNSCKFLQACINESLRLLPSVPNSPPRIVQEGGIQIDGEFIPPGITVGSSIYTLQRNSRYFTDPDEFRPQRWLTDLKEGESIMNSNREGFVPFSYGPRSCVAWRLAWTEMNVTLARTFFRYDMRLAPEVSCCGGTRKDCDYPLKGYITASVDGPWLQFRPGRS
ncbi:cytochrome P450 monooxygenase [Penicillium herquei]|nr:cytochrome P450 monooxygenase [Penicillium herquei]